MPSKNLRVSPATSWSSRFGANYKVAPNFFGISPRFIKNFGMTAGGFGAVAGIFAIQFFEGVPRLRSDVLEKIPVIGSYWTGREPPASDNPF